jgi:hypothetical protein
MRVLRADHQVGDRKAEWVNDHADHLTASFIGTAGAGPDDNRCLCHRPDLLITWMEPHEPAPIRMISRYRSEENRIHAISLGSQWHCLLTP